MKLSNCDIISINETWFKNDLDHIDIDGFRWWGHNRKLLNKKCRSGSGGVGVLIRNKLCYEYDINIIDKSFEGILCLKFTDKMSDYSFIFMSIYLPPENSMYGRDPHPFYNHLLGLLYSNEDIDAVYLAGDVNGRVGNLTLFLRLIQ